MESEIQLDKILKIKTTGRDDTNSNYQNFPYEPTPYSVLQSLINTGYITKKDKIIDYGCGKGRVSFYLAYCTKAKTIGIEYDDRLYSQAIDNHKKCLISNKVEFVHTCASIYEVPDDITGAYFFNPFSVTILMEVIKNIRKSKTKNNRDLLLFFYYPSKEYLSFLDRCDDVIHIEDINCMDHFKTYDKKEYISIYKI